MKKKLLVSFSGGETSAFMAQWLWKHKQDEFEMIFVFANTGQENEATLVFTKKCADFFGFPLIWIEGVFHKQRGKGPTHKVVTYETASRKGEPFEAVIAKYGIPNPATPHCSRDLKQVPIKSYARAIGWKDYYTAIGIRIDEIDRISVQRKKNRIYYPLCEELKTTKPIVNMFWQSMPFRLELKGYEGNCKWCWKKSDNKLYRIAKDNPEAFEFPDRMEQKYGDYFPEHRIKAWIDKGKEVPKSITFFRNNRSAQDILRESKLKDPKIYDDSQNFDVQNSLDLDVETESCDIYSECNNN